MSSEQDAAQRGSFGAPAVAYVVLNRKKGRADERAIIDAQDAALVGRFLWHLNRDGYAVRTVDPATGEKEPMARLIMGLRKGDGLETDHISRDKLDNRRVNLRVVSHAVNSQNQMRTDGNSRYRGVSRRKGKVKRPFQAYGALGGLRYHLGFHDEELEAGRAAEAWRREHFEQVIPDTSLDPVPACGCKRCRETAA